MKFRLMEDGWASWRCPGCAEAHEVPVEGPRAWFWNGSPDRPTLSPSVLVNVGGLNPDKPVCHAFVREGSVQFLGDSTHALAGKTVEIPDWH